MRPTETILSYSEPRHFQIWQAVIRGMLEHNPRSRLGAGGSDEVLGHPFIAEHMEISLLEQV